MFLHYSSRCFLSFSPSCFSCSASCCCTGSSSSLMISDDGRSIWFSEGGIGGSSTYSAGSGGGGRHSILIHVVFKLRWWRRSDVDDEETWNEGDDVAGVAFVLGRLSGAAGWSEDNLIVGRMDGGDGLFVLKMFHGGVFFLLFWFCALLVLVILGQFSLCDSFFHFIKILHILNVLNISN